MIPMISKDHVHYVFEPQVMPVTHAVSGDTVCFECKDCYAEQLTEDGMDFAKIDMSCNNPVTGPLCIDGAEPGDVLKVEIQKIELEDHGVMTVRHGVGTYEIDGYHCRRFAVKDGKISFERGIEIPIRPMIGVIGTCPLEPISTQSPGEHGGNMDIREVGEGSVLYLPVAVPGANLSMGDIHAVQGDGETAICAMECSGKITVRVTVLKNRSDIPTPFLVTENACYTTAADPSLDIASVRAARKMHHFLMEQAGLSDAQAAMFLSLKGNLRISQIVNPEKGCMMEFPRELLKQLSVEV